MSKNQDVLHVVLSDMHSGSNKALFINREWHGIKTSHIPRSDQIQIRKQWVEFINLVRAARKGKKVVLIHNGDAIDGDHHHSSDVCSANENEQADIHIELMIELQKAINWQRGDELYYVKGTETHTKDMENVIGKELNAIPNGDLFAWDFLELKTNGVKSWFIHHGSNAGNGANEGNSLKNWMRNLQIESMKDNSAPPDIIYSGHVHNPSYQTHTYRVKGFAFRTMHYIITPSWQMKIRYAWMKAPMSKNRIGGVIHEIKADGTIVTPVFSVLTTE